MREIRRSGGIAALVLAGGCAAAMEANKRAPGVISNEVFSPSRPPSGSYGPDAARTCPAGGVLQLLAGRLDDAARASGKPAAQTDGRLCAAAEALLVWTDPESPPESLLRFLTSYFGLPQPTLQLIITSVDTDDDRVIVEQLIEPLTKLGSTATELRYGLATLRVSGGGDLRGERKKASTQLVLVMQDRGFDLDPLPRRLAPNSQATLRGRLLGDWENPKISIGDPLGRLETPAVPPGKAFQVDLRCGDKPGLMPIEIRGEAKGASTVLASFFVACGVDQPASVAIPRPDQGTVDVALQEKRLFELINAERAKASLAALAWDDSVARVARGISEKERDQLSRGAAPVLEDPIALLAKAEVRSPLVLENPAESRSVEQAHERFLSSPRDRSNLMNSQVTHAGVGIASAKSPKGRSTMVVTELFIKVLPAVDAAAVRAQLRDALARKRADARVPPLAKDATLDDVAQKYAQELAATGGTLSKPRGDELVRPLYKSFRTVNLLSGSKADPLEFAQEPSLTEPAKVFGVGVAQGSHPAFGKNAVYVVLILGTRR